MRNPFRRARLETFVKTARQLRIPKPLKKQLPKAMQKIRKIEEESKKKNIIAGLLDVIELYRENHLHSNVKKIENLKSRIEKNGLDEKNILFLEQEINNLIDESHCLFRKAELEDEFRKEINEISPNTEINVSRKKNASHEKINEINIPPLEHDVYTVNDIEGICKKNPIKVKSSISEIVKHELMHDATGNAVHENRKMWKTPLVYRKEMIADNLAVLNETLSFLKQIETGGKIYVIKRFEYEKNRPTNHFGRELHKIGSESALLMSKLGINTNEILSLLNTISVRKIENFEDKLLNELEKADKKLRLRKHTKEEIKKIKNIILNKIRK